VRVCTFLLLSISVGAQTPHDQPAESGVIQGTVISAGEPVPQAEVTIGWIQPATPVPPQQSYRAYTTDRGTFLVKNVLPGNYQVDVTKTGFVRAPFPLGPAESRKSVTVASGETAVADFALTREAVIVGHLENAAGEPLSRAAIYAKPADSQSSLDEPHEAFVGVTNQNGDYRISGIAPGRYYIRIFDQNFQEGTFRIPPAISYQRSLAGYFFYPGTLDSAQAKLVGLSPGSTLELNLMLPGGPRPRNAGELRALGGTSSVSGRILNAATGQLIGNAAVVFRGADYTNHNIISRSDGSFYVQDLPPGTYSVSMFHDGFLSNPSVPKSSRSVPPLKIEAGTRLTGLDIAFQPEATISGRVLDSSGNPIPNPEVYILQYTYAFGNRLTAIGYSAQRNDLGEYFFEGLPPGRYYIAAGKPAGSGSFLQVDEKGEPGSSVEVTTLYPGVRDAATATELSASAGAHLTGIDIRLIRAATQALHGDVTGLDPQQPDFASVELNGLVFRDGGRAAAIRPDGTFEFLGVPSGSYSVAVREVKYPSPQLTANQTLEVSGSPVADLALAIEPKVSLRGNIRFDPPVANANLQNLTVSLRGPSPAPLALNAKIKADGSFEFPNLFRSAYDLNLNYGKYYVKSAELGGTDLLKRGFTLSGSAGPLLIVLSDQIARIRCVLRDENGLPVPGASVVVLPENVSDRLPYLPQVLTDEHGQASFMEPPGAYMVFAWDETDPVRWMDPDFIASVRSRSKTVRLGEGQSASVDLTLSPSPR
jgi:protocatechuate 3,4-dioxygenase beta subunit